MDTLHYYLYNYYFVLPHTILLCGIWQDLLQPFATS